MKKEIDFLKLMEEIADTFFAESIPDFPAKEDWEEFLGNINIDEGVKYVEAEHLADFTEILMEDEWIFNNFDISAIGKSKGFENLVDFYNFIGREFYKNYGKYFYNVVLGCNPDEGEDE